MVLFMKRFRGLPVDFLMNWFVIASPAVACGWLHQKRGARLRAGLADASSSAGDLPCPWVFNTLWADMPPAPTPGLFPRKHVCCSPVCIYSAAVTLQMPGDRKKLRRGGHGRGTGRLGCSDSGRPQKAWCGGQATSASRGFWRREGSRPGPVTPASQTSGLKGWAGTTSCGFRALSPVDGILWHEYARVLNASILQRSRDVTRVLCGCCRPCSDWSRASPTRGGGPVTPSGDAAGCVLS